MVHLFSRTLSTLAYTAALRVYMYLTINGFPYSAFPEYSCLAFSTHATLYRCFRFPQFPPLHFGADSRCFLSRCFMSRILASPFWPDLPPAFHLICIVLPKTDNVIEAPRWRTAAILKIEKPHYRDNGYYRSPPNLAGWRILTISTVSTVILHTEEKLSH